MAAINSGIGTKAFTYRFNSDGALNSNTLVYTGVTLKAGESVLDVRATVLTALAGADLAKKFYINAQIGDGSEYGTTIYGQAMNTLNGGGSSLASGDSTSAKFSAAAALRYAFNSGIDLPIYFTTEAGGTTTAGVICFVMTYVYTKF